MKNILLILDGLVAKNFLSRLIEVNPANNSYDVVYMNDYIVPDIQPSNFIFYKFDPTSASKLRIVLDKELHYNGMVILDNKADTVSVINNIMSYKHNFSLTVYSNWNIDIQDDKIQYYKGNEILANGLLEKLPDVPVLAQNVGLKQGEIMEIQIPFGSSYAYRYIGAIAQKDWKIFALYRNNSLVNIRPSLILKPNDIILIIGKPKVLLQVYGAITRTLGHFPMPFGNNIYIYLNLALQSESDILNIVNKGLFLYKKLKNKKLIIKITQPSTIYMIDQIKQIVSNFENIIIEIDYYFKDMQDIVKSDKKRFDVGIVVTSAKFLQISKVAKNIFDMELPIFKCGYEAIETIKYSLELLYDISDYTQISPMLFDISIQWNLKVKIINSNPLEDENRDQLVDNLENLAKIFGVDFIINTNTHNPIKELQKEKNILQILPLKHNFIQKRWSSFLNTNSDLLSYDLEQYNQILIPIVE
jgi:hypothetical protein